MADTLSPSIFSFHTNTVRVIVVNGDPWFVASDVAVALGYRDASNAARNLKSHQKGTHNLSTHGGGQKVVIITESGLYKLVLRSRKPEAEEFSDWVTGEVLPSIRKTGRYEKPGHEKTVNEIVDDWVKKIEEPNGYPAMLFQPLVDAVQRKVGRRAALTIDASDAKAMDAASDAYNDCIRAHIKAINEGKRTQVLSPSERIPLDVLQGILAQAMRSSRFMVWFDHDFKLCLKPIADDEWVTSPQKMARTIAVGDAELSDAELADLASACNQRLVKRLGNPAIVLAV